VEGVLPGVGTFHVPTLTGLDGAFSPLCAMRLCGPRSSSTARVLSES
jgi:hypothetical protein